MLRHIHIRDFAIVDTVDIDFEPGMSVLTGETGAGKSILLDALGLCLGDRADTAAVPEHADRAEINVAFDVSTNTAAQQWLAEQSLDADGDCVLRRIVQRNGRSQAWINGRPCPLQLLDALGAHLVDIHGQHAHQSLLRRETQREALDAFGAYPEAGAAVARHHATLRRLRDEIDRLEGGQDNYQDRLELLRYQVDELDALNLDADAIAELETEQRRLASAGETIETCQGILAGLYDDEQSVQSVLGGAIRRLEDRLDLDPAIANAHELLNDAQVALQEACGGLRHFVDALELDPQRLQWVEQRLAELTDLARKYRCRPEELPQRLQALRHELEALEGAQSRLAELAGERQRAETEYREAARVLSDHRRTAADALAARVTELIRELGIPGGELQVSVRFRETASPTAQGLDEIEFQVRTNPDQRFGPIAKVASGGELSRLGLALEVAIARVGRIPTLIFDEADTGIGGAVAEVVGRKLRELGEHHQVLCVTHLPQVAAQAHHQLKVEKGRHAGRTRTDIAALDTEARTQEIARMLGGVEITANTLNHAREMLQRIG